ncbi:MAG: hypothetical protein QM736_28565 [Vicinamibacterales bacterium]
MMARRSSSIQNRRSFMTVRVRASRAWPMLALYLVALIGSAIAGPHRETPLGPRTPFVDARDAATTFDALVFRVYDGRAVSARHGDVRGARVEAADLSIAGWRPALAAVGSRSTASHPLRLQAYTNASIPRGPPSCRSCTSTQPDA